MFLIIEKRSHQCMKYFGQMEKCSKIIRIKTSTVLTANLKNFGKKDFETIKIKYPSYLEIIKLRINDIFPGNQS